MTDLQALSQEAFDAVTRDRAAGLAALTLATPAVDPRVLEIAYERCRECQVEVERRISVLRAQVAALRASP